MNLRDDRLLANVEAKQEPKHPRRNSCASPRTPCAPSLGSGRRVNEAGRLSSSIPGHQGARLAPALRLRRPLRIASSRRRKAPRRIAEPIRSCYRGAPNSMSPRPSVVRFVRSVARAELARDGGARDGDVGQQITIRLHRELQRLLGPVGVDVLFARALVLAQRNRPALKGLTMGPGGTLAGVEAPDDGGALREVRMALVEHFVELLVSMIGEDLAMGLVT